MNWHITVNLGNLLLSLSDAMDLADPALIQHQQRTAFASWKIAETARLPVERLEKLFTAALLHDIGALSVEEKISLRNFKIKRIERHCIIGEILLDRVKLFEGVAKIVGCHHEPWRECKRPIESFPVLESQFLSLSDHLERLVDRETFILHQRDDIVSKIRALAGSQFHPDVVDAFLATSSREEF